MQITSSVERAQRLHGTQEFAGFDSVIHTKSEAIAIIRGNGSEEPVHRKSIKSQQLKNPKDVEAWFNECVKSYVESIDNDPLKTPLMRLKIDRSTLMNWGISSEDVDRLYLSIYVSSVSFFQRLADIIKHQKGNGLICRLWKGYVLAL